MSHILRHVVDRLQGKVEDKADVQTWQYLLVNLPQMTEADINEASWAPLAECLVVSLQTKNVESEHFCL